MIDNLNFNYLYIFKYFPAKSAARFQFTCKSMFTKY